MNKELNAAEAVYGFVGWLTTREERTVMSAKDDCAPIAELIKRFCTENNLPEVSDQWPLNLIHPSGEVAVPAAVAGPSGYGPNVTVRRSCSDCKACNSESYAVQGDSGHYVYCEHPSLPESKYIGDTNWNTPHWCPVSAPTTQPASQREPAEIDTATMVLAESVGLIGPASRTHDLHGAIQRFHDLICANATIKAAQMAAEAISAAAPQPSPAAQAADSVQEDAAELDFLKSDLLSCVQTVVGNGGAHHIIEDAYERYEAWLAAQEGK